MANKEYSFQVMTYNLNAAKEIKDIQIFKEELINEIERISPDLLCVQELSDRNLAEIQPYLDSIFHYSDTSQKTKYEKGCYLFSKMPISNIKKYNCSGEVDTCGFILLSKQEITIINRQMPVFSADIDFPKGKKLSIFNCHLRSNAYSTARRSMDKHTSWIKGIPLYYSNYKAGEKIRNYEAENLKPLIDSVRLLNQSVLVAGDMNSLGGSHCIRLIKGSFLSDAWWSRGFGFGVTFDAWNLLLRLDHLFYDSSLEVVNVFVPQTGLSDHRPLVADIRFRN